MKICYKINGRTVTKKEFDAFEMPKIRLGFSPPSVLPGYSESKPGKSLGMGCHRDQIGLLNDTIHAHGIQGVEYVPDKHGGECRITSRRGRARWMKIFGEMHGMGQLHDGEGGYSDG